MDTPINQEERQKNPRAKANWFSKLFFLYTLDTLKSNYDSSIPYEPIDDEKSNYLGNKLEKYWKNEINKPKKSPCLLKCIFKCFWKDFLVAEILVAIAEIFLRLAEPICLGHLLRYFQEDSTMTQNQAIFWASGIIIANGLRTFVFSQFRIAFYNLVIKIRVSLSILIYRKVLKLRSTVLQQNTGGKIINFLSSDLSKFDLRSELCCYITTSPILCIFIFFLLLNDIGYAVLACFAVMAIMTLIQAIISYQASNLYKKASVLTDKRIKLIDELLSGIQVIKMYAWEKSFSKLIYSARAEELGVLSKAFSYKAIYESIYMFVTPLNMACTMLVIILLGEIITVPKVYVLIIYLTLLNLLVSIFFSLAIAKSLELYGVISRIRTFLLSNEQKQGDVQKDEISDVKVCLKNVYAAWTTREEYTINEDDTDTNYGEKTALLKHSKKYCKHSRYHFEKRFLSGENVLSDININLEKNVLLGVIGPVGSGKSSLVQTILGELQVVSGTIDISGKISYAPQNPWTFSSTIRQNILFGLEYDDKRYAEVIKVCGLEADFQQFLYGDLTVIGDRGASLSGGQKARINLARAVYRKADIYILDDPLAAVDVHVAGHLFYKCILEFLGDKCRILVTHRVDHLKHADYLIYLKEGKINNQGTYQELAKCEDLFVDMQTDEGLVNQKPKIGFDITSYNELESSGSYSSDSTYSELYGSQDMTLAEKVYHTSKEKGVLIFKYLFVGNNTCFVLFTILLFVFCQVVTSALDYYIRYWSDFEDFLYFNMGIPPTLGFEKIYSIGVFVLIVVALLRAICWTKVTKSKSTVLHDKMFDKVIGTNMRFFDTTTSGRILNRFSKDLNAVDEIIPRAIMESGQIFLMSLGSFVLLAVVNLFYIIPVVVVYIIYAILLTIFLKLTKKVKRSESKLIGPMLTHINNTIQGITAIRALSAEEILNGEFEYRQDDYTSSSFLYGVMSITLSFYTDIVCFLFIAVVSLSLIFFSKSIHISSGLVGLAVTQVMNLSGVIQYGIRQLVETNNQLVAVERMSKYKNLPEEKDPPFVVQPPPNWPEYGEIVFDDVDLKYDEDLPLVLKNLNFKINPCEKVGIVGRTGAGKSSLISAMFRLNIVEGSIEIDGFDTRDIPLHTLRSRISIIPQDPVLFSGTLRQNLDPFGEYDDYVLNKAIKAVGLKDSSNNNLDYKVLDKGSNYSTGQRQLICLARAIIRNNKILMLDEATANIDPITDMAIQRTIRKEFEGCTVLTVAHRLNTIMDSDKVLVMEAGEVVEFEHPHILLQNLKGKFYSMVMESGQSEAERLKKIAFNNYIGWLKTSDKSE